MNELDILAQIRADAPAPSPEARELARVAAGEMTAPAPVAQRHLARRFVAAAAALAIAVGGAYVFERRRIDAVKPQHVVTITTSAPVPAGGPENFLLVGSDERVGDPTVLGQRSDTIIVVRLDPSTKHVLSVSIPRDLFVDIPGYGVNKINSAYSDNLPLLVSTIQQSLHVPIQHVMEVRFADYAALVDDVGGIRVDFPRRERDRYSGLDEVAGCQTLDGSAALSLVRSRHTQWQASDGSWIDDPAADFGRMRRQQLALRQMLAAAEHKAGVDPAPLLAQLFAHVIVDDGFRASDALALVAAFRGDRALDLLTLPTSNEMLGSQSGLRLAPGAQALLDALAGRSAAASSAPAPGPATGNVPPITESVVEQPC